MELENQKQLPEIKDLQESWKILKNQVQKILKELDENGNL